MKKKFLNVIMISENTEISEFNQYLKSYKAPFIVYADLECIIEKINGFIYSKSKEQYFITFFNIYIIFI